MDTGKVLRMDKHHTKPEQVTNDKSPRIIADCRRLVINGLKPLVSKLFENADDVLFDMADKAENNTIQSLYFDAMRLVRIKRHDLEEGFYKQFVALFNEQWKQNSLPAHKDIPSIPSLADAALIEDEDLEESLAITNMVSKAENRSMRELNALTQRFKELSSGNKITNENLPIGPTIICNAFRESLKTLDLGNKIKLIIYKLFDKYTISEIDAIYAQTNKLLIKRGVLPELRATIVKSADKQTGKVSALEDQKIPEDAVTSGTGATTGAMNTSCQPVLNEENVLTTLQQLLSSQRNLNSGNVVHMPGVNSGAGGNNTAAVTCDTQGILSSLAQVQKNTFSTPAINEQLLSGDVTLKSLLLNEMVEQTGEDARISINRNDEDVIDIVSMLFEFIIEDRNIPDSVKALLGRLQMTILRASLLDREFFSNKSHPVRGLLNELSSAAIGLDENNNDNDKEIYNKIKYSVNRILTEFDNDIGLFTELHEEFKELLQQLNQPHNSFDETVSEIVDVQASHQKVSEAVNEEISTRIEKNEMPEIVRDFLEQQWTDLLIKLHVEEGPDSSMWENSLRVADLMIWSTKPKISLENKQKLLLLIPGLLKALRHGMELLEYSAEEIEETVNSFQPYHTASLRGHKAEEGNQATDETVTAEDSNNTVASGPAAKQPVIEHSNDLSYTALSDNTDENIDDDIIEEIVLSDSLIPNDVDLDSEAEHKDDEYTDMVSNAAVGMWFGFSDETGSQFRARLSKITGISSRYIFVTRKGKNIIEKTFHGLAAELRRNTAQIIENVPLIDRALHAIVNGLKSNL